MKKDNCIKKVAAISDITGLGRCGLAMTIPVLSVLGHQVISLPTAIFSAHPWFPDFYRLSLVSSMPEILESWRKTEVIFDCVLACFFCSPEQIEQTTSFCREQKKKSALIVVDPVMGDNGSLYKIVTPDMISKMTGLVSAADIITPNYTEACVLLGQNAKSDPLTETEVEDMLLELSKKTSASVVIKSIKLKNGLVNACIDKNGKTEIFMFEKSYDKSFPGTGDFFAALLTGKLLNGMDFFEAVKYSGAKTTFLVGKTIESGSEAREGICVEKFLKDI